MMRKLTFPFLLLLTLSCCFNSTKKMASTSRSPSLEGSLQKAKESDLFSKVDLTNSWWELFNDPHLNQLMETALGSSPTLQKAEARVLSAQANAKAIRSNLFPNLEASADDNWQYLSKYGLLRDFFPSIPGMSIPSKFNETNLSLNFSYEIDFWGQNRKMLESALGLAAAEQMEKLEAKLILCTSIAFTYFTWQAHFAELVLYKKKLECEEKLVSLLEQRLLVGIDQVVPSLQEQSEKLALIQKIEELEKDLLVDEIFLKNLIASGPDAPLELVFSWNPSEQKAYLPDTLEMDLLSKRPDVMAQLWRVESARLDVGVAKTAFYPNVNLMALAGLSSLSFSHLFDWASRTGALRPAIHLPLFTGGRLEANLQESVALFNEAVFAYNEILLQAAKEVASEITTFLSIHKQIQEQEKKLFIDKELLFVATASFEVGTQPYGNVLLFEKNMLSKEIQEVQLQQSKILSLLRIIKALGGGTL